MDFSRARSATITDVARSAGVSKKSVSRVINDEANVSDELRQQVQTAIHALRYVPDPQARGLAFRRSFLVGLVYDNPNPTYVVNLQLGVLDALRGSDMEVLVHPADRTSTNFLADLDRFVRRHRLSGVVMPPSMSEDESVIAILRGAGCPYVRIASVLMDEPHRMVVTHDRVGGKAAALHLADLGHVEIAYVSGPPHFMSSKERGAGFVEGLQERGLSLPAHWVVTGAYTFESGREAGKALLTGVPRPSAIFVGNDEMAMGVMDVARELGLALPDQVSIVGFDDAPMAVRVWPHLTTVRLPIREMGRLAAQLLLSGVGGSLDKISATFHPTLVVRQSTSRFSGG